MYSGAREAFDLFGDRRDPVLGDGARLLAGFVLSRESDAIAAVRRVVDAAPFRAVVTPGGRRMSVEMTACGEAGWVSDASGYRYASRRAEDGAPWPAMPKVLRELARDAAAAAGYAAFDPEVCLINCYVPGARMSLHQDRHEREYSAPIVSVSLGLPAIFLFGGLTRDARVRRVPLLHGDAVVWGGPTRLVFHGVAPVEPGSHPLLGERRINLTFRRAGR